MAREETDGRATTEGADIRENKRLLHRRIPILARICGNCPSAFDDSNPRFTCLIIILTRNIVRRCTVHTYAHLCARRASTNVYVRNFHAAGLSNLLLSHEIPQFRGGSANAAFLPLLSNFDYPAAVPFGWRELEAIRRGNVRRIQLEGSRAQNDPWN